MQKGQNFKRQLPIHIAILLYFAYLKLCVYYLRFELKKTIKKNNKTQKIQKINQMRKQGGKKRMIFTKRSKQMKAAKIYC